MSLVSFRKAVARNIVLDDIRSLLRAGICFWGVSVILFMLFCVVLFSPRSVKANATPIVMDSGEIEKRTDPADYGSRVTRVGSWLALISRGSGMSDIEKLKAVNTFFNQLDYGDDATVWGKKDYWSVPEEFLAKGVGDCEDFALSKYCTLMAMAVEEGTLYLSCVTKRPGQVKPMVLCSSPDDDSDPLVLDNIALQVRPLSKRVDLIPIYNFDRRGIYVPQQRGERGRGLGFRVPLAKWHEYLDRVGRMEAQPGSLPGSGKLGQSRF